MLNPGHGTINTHRIMFDDDVWDEHAWESHLRRNDERVNRYLNHLIGYLAEHPMPAPDDAEALARWKGELRNYLESLGWGVDDLDEALGEDLEDDWSDEEFAAWANELEEDEEDELEDFDDPNELPVYRQAFELATRLLAWADELPVAQKDSVFVQFCTHLLQMPANIARGHGMGRDLDVLGGNIACLKRAIESANTALEVLPQIKDMPGLDEATYLDWYEALFETRNAIGLYIQDLRQQFDLGIE